VRPELFELRGKVAIVTGGNGGIGLGIARGLALAGASIAVVGRNADKNAAAVAELRQLGGEAVQVQVDVTQPPQVQRMVEQTRTELGGVDILIANAGSSIRRRPESYELAEWRQVLEANLTSVFACCQAVYPALKERGGGKIVTIGSMGSLFGMDYSAAYATSKAGVVQLTRSLAMAWAADQIQVNAILPGWIDTDLTRAARLAVAELSDKVLARTPAGRWGTPDDLAGAAVFLCSRASDFVTGVALPVDGGFSSAIW
jgi:2-dehydro-3-deoxy-D-gluconate 5-dehydrogenase